MSKKPRSGRPVALGSQVASSSSSRCSARWSAEAKGYALAVYDRCAQNVAAAVRMCLREKPTVFGSDRGYRSNGRKAAALSEQLLTTWVAARDNAKSNSAWFETRFGGKRAGAGRHRLLPASVMTLIIQSWQAVLSTKKTLFTTVQLQSVAIGVIVANGYGKLLTATRNGKRVFTASRTWVAKQCCARGWRFKKPFGDSDKPPENMNQLIKDYLHRIAYFVKVHNVAPELVINPDHTGLHYTQIKGGGWTADTDTPAVASGGDKRECTFVPCSSAAGRVCPTQLVVGGTTSLAMPQGIGKYKAARVTGEHLRAEYKGYGGQMDPGSVKPEDKLVPKWITHFAGTSNHWSDLVTSIDILVFVLIPFLAAEKVRLGLAVSAHAILILDCWWGWTSPLFKAYVRAHYPWVHLVYVPGRCTPWAQPADRGYITRIKAFLRKYSAELITSMLVRQLFTEGRSPADVEVDIKGATTCKTNLARWVAAACEEMDKLPEVVKGYWRGIGVAEGITKNGLLDAWDSEVQEAAYVRRFDLFSNMQTEEDPNSTDTTSKEPPLGHPSPGFGEEAPGVEADLARAGVMVSYGMGDNTVGDADMDLLDRIVEKIDAILGTKTPPDAPNIESVVAEVVANANEPDEEDSDDDDEEDGGSDSGGADGDTGTGGAGGAGDGAAGAAAGAAPGA